MASQAGTADLLPLSVGNGALAALSTLLLSGTGADAEAVGIEPVAADESALDRFLSGVDEALENLLPQAEKSSAAADAVPAAPMLEILDRAFQDWLWKDDTSVELPEADRTFTPARSGAHQSSIPEAKGEPSDIPNGGKLDDADRSTPPARSGPDQRSIPEAKRERRELPAGPSLPEQERDQPLTTRGNDAPLLVHEENWGLAEPVAAVFFLVGLQDPCAGRRGKRAKHRLPLHDNE